MGNKFYRWDEFIRASSGDVRRLTSVWRYSSIPIAVNENTADHSYWVALYSAMILQELDITDPQVMAAATVYALVHDVAECVTGDVVRILKYATPEMKQEVDRAVTILMKETHPSVQALVRMADKMMEDQTELIKTIVKVADFVSLFQFMRREAMRGNLEIFTYYQRMQRDLEMMEQKDVIIKYGSKREFAPSFIYSSLRREADRIRSVCFRSLEANP
jgi:5'-deoxynucleotidase YfbR-like HD superfamily hydrolase